MEKFELLETFLTGHPVIDAQHFKIVTAVNAVSKAITQGNFDQGAQLLDTFLHLCENHFKSEEALLAALNYPDLENHTQFHRDLVLRAKAVKVLCLDTTNPDNIERCFNGMATLLIEDIVKGDLQFVSFLIERKVVKTPPSFSPLSRSK